jgi:hypothetical protein
MLVTKVVAVIVAGVLDGTCGAVNKPRPEITPILLLHVTMLVFCPLAKA